MTTEGPKPSIPVETLVAFHAEDADEVNALREQLRQLRESGGEAVTADPDFTYALGKAEGRKEELDGLLALIATWSIGSIVESPITPQNRTQEDN